MPVAATGCTPDPPRPPAHTRSLAPADVPAPGVALLPVSLLSGAGAPGRQLLAHTILPEGHALCLLLAAGAPSLAPAPPSDSW